MAASATIIKHVVVICWPWRFFSLPELSGGDDFVKLICSSIGTPYLFSLGWPTSGVAHLTASQDGHEFKSGTEAFLFICSPSLELTCTCLRVSILPPSDCQNIWRIRPGLLNLKAKFVERYKSWLGLKALNVGRAGIFRGRRRRAPSMLLCLQPWSGRS